MRLYLSSYGLGAHVEELVRMAGPRACGWVVPNALDGGDEERRAQDTARQNDALAGLEHCDPTDEARRLHGEVRTDGLGVLDRPVVPHLDSPEHRESELLGEVSRRYPRDGIAHWRLRDGEVLVVDGDRAEVV